MEFILFIILPISLNNSNLVCLSIQFVLKIWFQTYFARGFESEKIQEIEKENVWKQARTGDKSNYTHLSNSKGRAIDTKMCQL